MSRKSEKESNLSENQEIELEKLDENNLDDEDNGSEVSSKHENNAPEDSKEGSENEDNDCEGIVEKGLSKGTKESQNPKGTNSEDQQFDSKVIQPTYDENNQLLNSEKKTQKEVVPDRSAGQKAKKLIENMFKKLDIGNRYAKQEGDINSNDQFLIKRRFLRIFFLVLFEVAIILGIVLTYTYFGYIRGKISIVDEDSIDITTNSCQIRIIDYSLLASHSIDLDFMSKTEVPSSLSDNLLLTYVYPNSPSSSESLINDNVTKKLNFINSSELLDCQIVIYVYKQTKLKSLDINCEIECQIFYASTLLSSTNLSIKGPRVTINAPNLVVETLSFATQFGTFESSNILFTSATIETSNGDISLQSLKSIEVDVELSKKLYCVSTFNSNTITDTVSQVASSSCKNVFAYSDQEKDVKNKIASRCYQGKIIIKSGGSEANQLLKAGNTEGNLFINVLPREGAAADQSNNVFVYDSTIYGADGDQISLSTASSLEFSDYLKLATKPNIYDPIFIFQFGKQFDLSSSYSQWQMTFNPAYSYLRPWWLGTLTLGLLNSQQFIQDVVLAPGFCPHVPSLSQKRQYIVSKYLTSLFSSLTNHESYILSQSQSASQPLPPVKFSSSSVLQGWTDQILADFYSENWIIYSKQLDGTINVSTLSLSQNGTLKAALIVSIILATLIGIIVLIGVVFAINRSYIFLLDHLSNVEMYGKLNQVSSTKANLEFALEHEDLSSMDPNNSKKQKNLNNYEDKVGEIKKQQYNYTINGLVKLFTNLIILSPPLSAYIDQVVIMYNNARRNSVVEFYSFLFREIDVNEKSSDKIIHNLDKDSINGQELKSLYEKFCYVNKLYERKLDDELSLKEAEKRGFKIIKMYDSLVRYFQYIRYNGQVVSMKTNQDNQSSLDQFISVCCSLTKFESDQVDSITFEEKYQEFCSINHLARLQLGEGQLKETYGIETRYDPLQVISRDPNYDLKVQKKMFIVDKNRFLNYLTLLLADDMKDASLQGPEMQEPHRIIYSPPLWILTDTLTVFAHLAFVLLIGSPFIALIINVRAQQSEYSSSPLQSQIFYEDLINTPATIPYKLASDGSLLSETILILTLVFWTLSTFDLILYYSKLDFPQDQYFKKYNNSGLAQRISSQIMWILVLIIIYAIIVYLSLLGTWMVLSAIINPEAFLPYATSAATFVTLIVNKYQQFKQISDDGFKIIIDFLNQYEGKLFKQIINKMDIGLNSTKILPTEAIKGIYSEASNLGLIDQKYSEGIQENLELMIRDPEAVSHLGQKALSIARDPRQAVSDLISNIEQKTQKLVEEQLKQYLPVMHKTLTSLILALFKGNKQQVAQEISIVFSDIYAESFQKDKDDQGRIQFLNILKGSLIRFLLEFNSISAEGSREDQIEKIMQSFSIVTSQLIATKFPLTPKIKEEISKFQKENEKKFIESASQQNSKDNKSNGNNFDMLLKESLNFAHKGEQITQKTLDVANSTLMQKLFKMNSYCSKKNMEGMLIEFLELVPRLQNLPQFKQTADLNQFTNILTLIIKANSDVSQVSISSLHPIFRYVLEQSNIENELGLNMSLLQLLDFIILVMNSTLKLEKSSTINEIKSMFSQLFSSSMKAEETQKVSSIVAFVLLSVRGGQSKIPIDILQDVIDSLISFSKSIKDPIIKVQLEKLNSVLQGSNPLGGVSQSRLYLIQDVFSFFNGMFSNFKAQFKILEKNSKSGYGLPEDSSKFVINLLKQKLKITTKEEDKALINSKDFKKMATIMKMTTFELHGFIHFLIGKSQTVQYRGFISCILRQYKVDEFTIDQLIFLQNLVCSKNEYDLNEALCYFFKKPLEGKIIGTKKVIKNEHIPLILLFVRRQLDYSYCKSFIDDNIAQYFDLIPTKQYSNDEIIYEIKKQKYSPPILEFLIKNITIGQITPQQVNKIIDYLNLEKPIEGLIKKVFGQVVSLQNLYFEQITATSTQFKESVTNISNLLNIEEKTISAFVSLILCQGDRTFDHLVESFQIPIQSYNGYKFIENYVSMIEQQEQNQLELEKVTKTLFDNHISKAILHSVLNHMVIPWNLENIYFLYSLTEKSIPQNLNFLIQFAFGIIDQKQLMTFSRDLIINDQQIQNGKSSLSQVEVIKRQKGLLTLLSLFKNQNKRENIQTFLQYLYDSKQEQLLIKNCLLCYFGGISEGVIITIEDKKSASLNMSVQEFLSLELDIKIEFFNALPSLFCSDLLNFCTQFIKFFRQVDYQRQRQAKQKRKSKVKPNQVLPLEQVGKQFDLANSNEFKLNQQSEETENKQIISDNFENNITISDKEVEQYIKLVKGDSINTSFFSRDLKLPLDVVEFLQALNQIKASNSSTERIFLLQQLKNNQSALRIFKEIKVKVEDFINGILFMYKDFDIFDEVLLKEALNMSNEDRSSVIKNLLLLDQDTDPSASSLQKLKFLWSTMETNEILGHLGISPQISTLTYCLTQDFFLLKELLNKNIILKLGLSHQKQIQNLLFGMFGVIQRRKLEVSSETFFKSLYLTLNSKNSKIKESQSTQEEDRQILNIIAGNSFEYAIMLLNKETQFSPVWILLMSLNINAWEYYLQRYYRTFRYKISKKPSFNPVITLVLILKLQSTPTLVKEMISQLEVVLSYQELQPLSLEEFGGYENKISKLLENLLDCSKDNIVELATKNKFPLTILKHIAQEEIHYLDGQNQNLSEEEILKKSLNKARENIKKDLNNNYRKFAQNLYTLVDQSCFKENNYSLKNKQYNELLHLNPISHLLLISSINQLSVASSQLFHHNDLGIDHHKQASYLIDFILNTFDKFYLFQFKKASFLKKYLTPIVGIVAGFSIDENTMLECNPTCNILSFQDLKRINEEKMDSNKLIEFKKEKAKLVFKESVEATKNYFPSKEKTQKPNVPPVINDLSMDEIKQILDDVPKKEKSNQPITYFRVFNSGLFYFFSENALIGNQAIKRINMNYYEYLESNQNGQIKAKEDLTKEVIEQIDSKLIQRFSEIQNIEKEFKKLTINPNYLFLINLFKQNYELMQFNSYFNQKHQKEIRFFIAVLDLYGCLCDSQIRVISDDQFLSTALIFSQNMQSNKKSLHQMLSLFVEQIETNISSISESFNTDTKMLNSFATVFFNHSRYEESDMNTLLNQTSYSAANRTVLNDIISLYHGDLDKLMDLVKFSSYFSNSNNSFQELSQFILSFDTDNIMSQNTKDNRIRLLSFQTLKLDFAQNRNIQQDILFKLSKQVIDDKMGQPKLGQQDKISEQEKQKIKKVGEINRSIDEILRNEWNFLFQNEITNEIKNIFGISQNQLEVVKLLCILRSNSSLKISSQLISKTLSNNYIRTITELLISLKIIDNQVTPSHLQILLGLSSNMPLLALDGILKFCPDFSDKPSQQNTSNQNDLATKNDNEQSNHLNKKILLILRSILIFKQLIVGDPEKIFAQLKDNDLRENIYISIQFFISHFLDLISSFVRDGNTSTASGHDNKNSEEYYLQTLKQFSEFKKRSNNQLFEYDSSHWNERSNQFSTNEIFYILQSFDKNNSLQFFGLKFFTSNIVVYLLDSFDCLSFLKALLKSQFETTQENRDKVLKQAFQEDSFFIEMVFKDMKIESSIKQQFGDIFLSLNKSFYVLQSKYKEKTQKELIKNLKTILEECYYISTKSKTLPVIIKTLLDAITKEEPPKLKQLLATIATYIIKGSDFGQFFGVGEAGKDESTISKKLYLVFTLLEGVFVRPSINLSNESVQTDVINALLLIGGDQVNSEVIKATISIMQGNIKGIYQILSELSLIGQNELNAIKTCVNSTQKLSIFKNKQSLQEMQNFPSEVLDDQMKDILKRMAEGKIDLKDIFRTIVYKEGNHGMISLNSFCTFLSRTGIELSSHRRNEIFAIIKKGKKTTDSNKDQLSEEEFELAYDYVNQKKIGMTLEQLGISPALLTLTLGTLIIILILLFVFIFLGIKAFTLGGTFGSIINSIIPMAAASGAANSQEDKSKNLSENKIKSVIKETQLILHSKQL